MKLTIRTINSNSLTLPTTAFIFTFYQLYLQACATQEHCITFSYVSSLNSFKFRTGPAPWAC